MHTLGSGLLSGALVGLVLGLIGGGGSILAVPMLIYIVGIGSPHVAIGTSAVAVATNALINLGLHARYGTVKWRCAGVFALAGMVGAWVGSLLGKATDGQRLLAVFGAVMMVVGLLMLRQRRGGEEPDVHLDMASVAKLAPRLIVTGTITGLASGYFGIGGGFLIVPALIFATRMPILAAIGSSLVAVTLFGATTALNYSRSGLVDWPLAGAFITAGVPGGLLGSRLATALSRQRHLLNTLFGVIVIGIGLYILLHGLTPILRR